MIFLLFLFLSTYSHSTENVNLHKLQQENDTSLRSNIIKDAFLQKIPDTELKSMLSYFLEKDGKNAKITFRLADTKPNFEQKFFAAGIALLDVLDMALYAKHYTLADWILNTYDWNLNAASNPSLSHAISRGDLTGIEWLLERGANPNKPFKYEPHSKEYKDAVIFATTLSKATDPFRDLGLFINSNVLTKNKENYTKAVNLLSEFQKDLRTPQSLPTNKLPIDADKELKTLTLSLMVIAKTI